MGKVQEVTDQPEVPRIGSTFALDMQSPRSVRICHSVGNTRSREAGANSSGRKKNPCGFFATQEGDLAVVLFLLILHHLKLPNMS